jgi:hypothetical protein
MRSGRLLSQGEHQRRPDDLESNAASLAILPCGDSVIFQLRPLPPIGPAIHQRHARHGPRISAKHVGTAGAHRDESDTLWLDGKDNRRETHTGNPLYGSGMRAAAAHWVALFSRERVEPASRPSRAVRYSANARRAQRDQRTDCEASAAAAWIAGVTSSVMKA